MDLKPELKAVLEDNIPDHSDEGNLLLVTDEPTGSIQTEFLKKYLTEINPELVFETGTNACCFPAYIKDFLPDVKVITFGRDDWSRPCVEGVNEFQIFWYIVIPLMKPAIAALSVLIFTFIWNDYFWATVLTQGVDSQPVTAGLYSLNGQWISQWHLVSAGSIVAALPPVVMFFTMQKHFIAGLTLGAVK